MDPQLPYDKVDYRRLGLPVASDQEGQRVDFYLSKNFLFLSRNKWMTAIKKQMVLVNGKPISKSSHKLKAHDSLEYFRPTESEPDVDTGVEIVWQNKEVMVVYKPSNLPMHEAGAYKNNTFEFILRKKFGEEWAGVHRLDRETSGLVLCAATPPLRGELCRQLRERSLEKTYTAIALGSPKEEVWYCDEPIGQAENTLFRLKQWVTEKGSSAFTVFEVMERGPRATLLRVTPKTGRTHQIRVHASYKDLPLVGDKKYSPDESVYLEYLDNGFNKFVAENVLFDRLCLHARELRFIDPQDNEEKHVTLDMPQDMHDIWNQLKMRIKG